MERTAVSFWHVHDTIHHAGARARTESNMSVDAKQCSFSHSYKRRTDSITAQAHAQCEAERSRWFQPPRRLHQRGRRTPQARQGGVAQSDQSVLYARQMQRGRGDGAGGNGVNDRVVKGAL